jgi:dipeptidyl aminopeptidase/acylaminoacyl peptidase
MRMNRRRTAAIAIFLTIVVAPCVLAESYQRPPKEIVDILDAPASPIALVSPAGNAMLLATPVTYRPISDFAEPFFRGGGVRINPRNNASYLFPYYVALKLQALPGGTERPIALPAGMRVTELRWNAIGSMFAFANVTPTNVELWVGDAASGNARRIDGLRLNSMLGFTISWMPDQKRLLVKTVPSGRGQPPAESNVPLGPRVEETGGVKSASSTYEGQELMKTPHNAELFEYYAPSQLALVDPVTGTSTPIGEPVIAWKLLPAPGGQYLLIERLHRPFSLIRMINRFAADVDVWDVHGAKVETLASLPVAEQVPIDGVRTGPREHAWRATAPATVVWVEALDDGDTYRKVPHHDRVMMKPIGGTATELMRLEQRFQDIEWLENGGRALVTEADDEKHWVKVFLVDAEDPTRASKVVWSLNADDAYSNPGDPVLRRLPNGAAVIRERNGSIFTSGEGASPAGNRPFLDRVDLRTLKSERLFQSPADVLESFVAFADPAKLTFVTRRETRSEPPNFYLRTAASSGRQLTSERDPAPQLRRVSKRLVTYQRPDGVKLSFTLYLPPGYTEGTRLPTILSAYPLDFTDPNAAGQVAAAPQNFTTVFGASPIFLALAGYAVLDETAMPVVGPTATVYDTFVEQIVANAQAAIEKAVELGVTDRNRVGVMGHSHGALMTASLLAWSDLFRAGVARSGAYNQTLRPFGFQFERRTLYQAPETYLRLSPTLHADRINEPLLLIHGENDNNAGTVPLQSEKLFEAIRGTGGTARLVMLPLEIHGIIARESVEQTLYETLTWFDRYVKNAPPKAESTKHQASASGQASLSSKSQYAYD